MFIQIHGLLTRCPSSDHLPYFCIEKSGLVVCLSAMESVSQSRGDQVQAPLINCAIIRPQRKRTRHQENFQKARFSPQELGRMQITCPPFGCPNLAFPQGQESGCQLTALSRISNLALRWPVCWTSQGRAGCGLLFSCGEPVPLFYGFANGLQKMY